ncbi:CAP-Gly domain-containing linker protein 3-like [Malurus melanocephalus]|uniref:CAP-Gly domain-containing linker protein 3-like n=1 Tax=Malurus melanocephalus TaxID=175006 RepID=UPI002546639F|nr:CAP-Gly domain-containing linker protein 3-like [Malurus melanocephalus]
MNVGVAWVGVVTLAPPPGHRKRSGAWLDREGRRVAPGDAVLVAGQRQGRARFYGRTDFAPGYWFGVELDTAGGKHDGSVFGVRYFSCPPKHGVFAPPSRVQRYFGGKLGDFGKIGKKLGKNRVKIGRKTAKKCGES